MLGVLEMQPVALTSICHLQVFSELTYFSKTSTITLPVDREQILQTCCFGKAEMLESSNCRLKIELFAAFSENHKFNVFVSRQLYLLKFSVTLFDIHEKEGKTIGEPHSVPKDSLVVPCTFVGNPAQLSNSRLLCAPITG